MNNSLADVENADIVASENFCQLTGKPGPVVAGNINQNDLVHVLNAAYQLPASRTQRATPRRACDL